MASLHDKIPIPPIVSLRRYGDILGLLPLLRFLSFQQKAPVKLVVHRAFSSILDGVSYVDPIIWDGDMDDPLPAAKKHGGINAQVHGKGLFPNRSISDFAKHSWTQLGYKWNRHLPLVLDRRNSEREKLLAEKTYTTKLPKILVKLKSFSSPFPDEEKIRKLIQDEFSTLAEIVNLDEVNGERIYDLLGLLDKAACMVSADTCTLWLAKASNCPVVALVNPAPFLDSPPTGHVLLRLPYTSAVPRWDRIATAIHSTLFDPGGDGMALVFSEFTPSDLDTKRRNGVARATWPLLKARLLPFNSKRNSNIIGDHRGMHFVRDMIDGVFSSGPEKIAIIINNDIKVDAKLGDSIRKGCDAFGCWWAYRVEAPGTETDRGADVFAVTRFWWAMHRHLFPDSLIGYWWWDDITVRIMLWSGCSEQERLYYHEAHPSAIATRGKTPGMMYNEKLALEFLKQHHELPSKP